MQLPATQEEINQMMNGQAGATPPVRKPLRQRLAEGKDAAYVRINNDQEQIKRISAVLAVYDSLDEAGKAALEALL